MGSAVVGVARSPSAACIYNMNRVFVYVEIVYDGWIPLLCVHTAKNRMFCKSDNDNKILGINSYKLKIPLFDFNFAVIIH
jgi:hypothetical protein